MTTTPTLPVAIRTVLRDDDLILRWLPGRASRMVVVFTGMKGGIGGEPLDEFAASASCGGENDVLFVSDRRATWYAGPGIWSKVLRAIRAVRDKRGVREVVTLGNSMGGYGALILPGHLRVRRAIAFSPQVTMDRSILPDLRWPDVHRRWGPTPERNVADTVRGTPTHYYLLAGAAEPRDVAHLDLMPDDAPRVYRWVLPGAGHNLARALKERGLLGDVVSAIIRGRQARLDALLDRYAGAAA